MQNLASLLKEFNKKRILIVGEISVFNNGSTKVHATSAALVALYANSLGANVSLVGTIGPDFAGSQLVSTLRIKKINIDGLIIDPLKATLSWQKLPSGQENSHLNFITEHQIIDLALKQAANTRAILYICQNPNSFSEKVYTQLRKVSQGLRIPFAIFSSLPFFHPSRKLNDLFILHNKNDLKLSKKLCAKISANDVLVISNKTEVNLINKEMIQHRKNKTTFKPHQFEAAVSSLALLLLSCNKYPLHLDELLKNMSLNNTNITIRKTKTDKLETGNPAN